MISQRDETHGPGKISSPANQGCGNRRHWLGKDYSISPLDRAGILHSLLLAGMEDDPRAGDHVLEDRLRPIVLGMGRKEGLGVEVLAARMAGARDKAHFRRHVAVGSFSLHGAVRIIRAVAPDGDALWSLLYMAAERTLVGFLLVQKRVVMVAEKPLGHGHVDLALIGMHQLPPTDAACVRGRAFVGGIEAVGFIADKRRITREVGTDEVAVLFAPYRNMFQPEFQICDFAGFAVADEPVVRVSAIVALAHDGDVVINRIRILHGLAGAGEFGDSVRIPADKLAD